MKFVRRYWRGVCITLLFGVTLCLGWYGIRDYFFSKDDPRSFLEIMYFAVSLFFLETGEIQGSVSAPMLAARWLGALVALSAVAGALFVLFRDRIQELRLHVWRRHVVVCGLGRKGMCLVGEFRQVKKRVVVIESDVDNPNIPRCRDLGAIVLPGDGADRELWAWAGATRARYIFLVMGDDGANVAAALKLHHLQKEWLARLAVFRRIASRMPGFLTCFFLSENPVTPNRMTTCVVHMVDVYLSELFKQHRLFRDDTDRLEVRVFNTYKNAARMLLAEHPLEGETEGELRKDPHLALLGFGKMGQAVALQAVKMAHYASGNPLRVTVVDRNAERLHDILLGHYPAFDDLCRASFFQGEISSATTIERIVEWARDETQRLTVVVCLDDDRKSLEAAMRLAARLRGLDAPVYVRMAEIHGLAALFDDQDHASDWHGILRPFGTIDQTCRSEAVLANNLDMLARARHASYMESKSGSPNAATDPAMQPWDRLAPAFRDSNRQQADHIPVKLRAIGCRAESADGPGEKVNAFTEDEIELLAEMEHARWIAERRLGGWTLGTCAPQDKERLRISPYLVPWEDLADAIRENDRAAVRAIPELLGRIGEKVVRTVP